MCPGHSRTFAEQPREHAVARGMKLGLPIFLGYVPAGAAFGILARTIGLSTVQATICSASALAGAGQFIALELMGAGATVAAVLIATSVVNLRYVLFASTISPHLRDRPLRVQAMLAFTLTDETFAINITDLREGKSTWRSMAGVGAVAWTGWVLGTFVGAAGAGLMGDPNRWGVQFAMPAMFTALFVALSENRRQVVTGLLAALLVLVLPFLSDLGMPLPQSWFVIVASVVAASVGSVVFR